MTNILISALETMLLAAALSVDSFIASFAYGTGKIKIPFVSVFIFGLIKLFDSSIKSFIRKHKGIRKQLRFSMFSLNFILNIYADPEDADTDSSRDLSPREAVSLAIALSLDGLAVGFGAGLANFNIIEVIVFHSSSA